MSTHIKNTRNALLLGATGLIGGALLPKLLDNKEYDRVYVVVRGRISIEHPKLVQVISAMTNDAEIELALAEITASDVYCCLGTTIKKAGSQASFRYVDVELPLKFAKFMQVRGMNHFLIVTAIGTDVNSSIFYAQMKGLVEQQLKEMRIPRLTILRPSLLLGNRHEFRLGEKISIIISSMFTFAMIGPLKKYKPIHASRMADAMFMLAMHENEKNSDTPIVAVLENQTIYELTAKHR